MKAGVTVTIVANRIDEEPKNSGWLPEEKEMAEDYIPVTAGWRKKKRSNRVYYGRLW